MVAEKLWHKRAIRPKVFCIGLNKTGTTSLEKALQELGFQMGNQRAGEELIDDWGQRSFAKIIRLAYTADAFQDIPFSLPYTYQALDAHFPNAKFILTMRNSAEEWYESLLRFHSKLWADGTRPPTADDLAKATYVSEGHALRTHQLMFDVPTHDLYNRDRLIQVYQHHAYSVREFFRTRKGKLIEINLSVQNDYSRLCEFLEKPPVTETFPWINKS